MTHSQDPDSGTDEKGGVMSSTVDLTKNVGNDLIEQVSLPISDLLFPYRGRVDQSIFGHQLCAIPSTCPHRQ
jgi:hypothetical protein